MSKNLILTTEAAQAYVDALIGQTISYVWFGYGSALFLEFGNLKASTVTRKDGSAGSPTGDYSLMIEEDWRLENDVSIVCGSASDRDLYVEKTETLIGCTVRDVELVGLVPELCLLSSNEYSLKSFTAPESSPSWTYFYPEAAKRKWIRFANERFEIGSTKS